MKSELISNRKTNEFLTKCHLAFRASESFLTSKTNKQVRMVEWPAELAIPCKNPMLL